MVWQILSLASLTCHEALAITISNPHPSHFVCACLHSFTPLELTGKNLFHAAMNHYMGRTKLSDAKLQILVCACVCVCVPLCIGCDWSVPLNDFWFCLFLFGHVCFVFSFVFVLLLCMCSLGTLPNIRLRVSFSPLMLSCIRTNWRSPQMQQSKQCTLSILRHSLRKEDGECVVVRLENGDLEL